MAAAASGQHGEPAGAEAEAGAGAAAGAVAAEEEEVLQLSVAGTRVLVRGGGAVVECDDAKVTQRVEALHKVRVALEEAVQRQQPEAHAAAPHPEDAALREV